MAKLSDTQLVILSAACQRENRLVLPLPENLKGGAATKVVASLLAKGLVEEVDAKHGESIWRQTGDGHGVTLVATDAAITALGIEPDIAPQAAHGAEVYEPAPREADTGHSATTVPAAPTGRKTREGTKQAELITMLKRSEGATIAEIVAATGWQAHTVRGAMAGALKKKLGLTITSEKITDRGRTYRIAD
ncbi:MAG: DUF3489 domain-containing protein [Rhizobiales bacterium]|nr:DUF3489 domain-containing protein [Hyphomicrobiales bacterium]